MKIFYLKMNKLLLTLTLLAFCCQLNAQSTLVTYVGSGTMAAPGDWTVGSNWDTGMVPGINDDVVITGNVFVEIPTMVTITVQSVEIKSGADFIINGTLNVGSDDGGGTNGALDLDSTSGTVTNNGTVNATNNDESGVYVKGTFTNNGDININGAGTDGLFVTASGTFINMGMISITGAVDDDHIVVDSGTTGGIRTSSSFINSGDIDITMLGGDEGILLAGGSTFDNNAGGTIDIINNGGVDGIVIEYTTDPTKVATSLISTFNNAGNINISGSSTDNGLSLKGSSLGTVVFNNSGTLNIMDTEDDAIALQEFATWNNSNMVTIMNSGDHGIEIKANATWINSGIWKDVNSDGDGLQIDGTAMNSGTLIIDITGITSDAIEVDDGTFDNTGGVIESGCNDTTNEFELRGNVDLGSSCFVFDIAGTSAGSNEFDQIDVLTTFPAPISSVDISGVTAKLEWAYTPEIGDCFKIVDGAGLVIGEFASIVSSDPTIAYELDYSVASEVELCVVAPCELVVDCSNITDQNLECRADLPPVDFNLVFATDSCGAVTKSALTIIPGDSGCPGDPITITREYFLNDGTTQESCMQTFTVESTIAPTVTCPADITVGCDADISPDNTGMATGTASCSNFALDITFTDVSTQGTGCGANNYTITRTWTATDACDRTATCDQIITVEDSTPPVITCPADVTIECDEDTSPANTGAATIMDDCSAESDIVITSSDESTQGMMGCMQYQYTITRTWMAMDACGNSSTCVQTIEVDDTTPPVITCPANLDDLDCLSGPLPTANTIAEFIDIGGTGMDNCSTADEWTIEFSDSPAGRDLLDYCSSNPADRTLTRTYSISDACGNSSTCAQTFTFNQSLLGPIITEIPLDQVVTCGVEAFPQMAAFNAETDCALGSTKMVEALPVIGTENCPGARYQFRYTVEDVCGRMATHVQTYTIQNDPFEYICPTIDCEIDCDATAEEAIAAFDLYTQHAIFVTSCAGLDPVVSYSFNPNSLGGCGSQTTVNFTATDPCGRSASCASTIVVVDNTAPIISGSIPSAFRNCGAFANSDYQSWGQDAMNSVEIDNNCDNTITWSYAPSSPNTENCGTGLISTTIVTFTATDNCGNASTTSAKFYLKDGSEAISMTVSGHLRTENDELVELVDVNASGAGIVEEMETVDDGYYEFALPSENNYIISPSRNDNPLNGISTMDLIMISQHVLGVQILDSPYRLIAADVDNSGTITAFDMIELRKLILMIDDEFTNNTSWRFVSEDFVFANPTNPFASTFPEEYSINDLVDNEIADFVAIKIGDVNSSAIPNQLVTGDAREGLENLVFQVADRQLKTDETYTVDFKAKDFTEVLGYQFTLDFDSDQLELVDYTSGELKNLGADNFASRSNEGVLTSSWNLQSGITLTDEAVLFSITFKAKANVELSKAINLSSLMTTAEAYNQSGDLMNLALEFNTEVSEKTEAFALYQNQPNPFKEQTLIGFNLPEASEATLTIYDVSGRLVQQIQNDFVKGYNEVQINRSDLENIGLLYYRLETNTDIATKRMIISQ